MKGIHLVVFVLLNIHSFAQNELEDQIKDHMEEQQQAWNNGDIDGFMLHYWNDTALKFVSKKGISMGWEQVLDNYKKAYPDKETMGWLVFELEEVRILDEEHAMVIGSWLLERDELDELGGFFTLLWELKEDRWVITVDHTS